MIDTNLTAAEISYLIFNYAPRTPDPCPICGADLTISEIANGVVTYTCPAVPRLSGTAQIIDHWRRSEQKIGFHGDERIVAILHELRQLRAAAGDDMTVPAGERYFPNGHGKNRCWQYWEHTGADQWEQRTDLEYTHDPTHADQT